jgi:hypothetical protein
VGRAEPITQCQAKWPTVLDACSSSAAFTTRHPVTLPPSTTRTIRLLHPSWGSVLLSSTQLLSLLYAPTRPFKSFLQLSFLSPTSSAELVSLWSRALSVVHLFPRNRSLALHQPKVLSLSTACSSLHRTSHFLPPRASSPTDLNRRTLGHITLAHCRQDAVRHHQARSPSSTNPKDCLIPI